MKLVWIYNYCNTRMRPTIYLARYRRTCLLALVACLVIVLIWARLVYFTRLNIATTPPPLGHSKGNRKLYLVVLPKALADKHGAYCLDGSPPSYYIRKASTAKASRSWIVVLQGGGWCWNATDCYRRSLGGLGSSRRMPKSTMNMRGIMSADSTVNPEFYDWNQVVINYCDGASFSGNLVAPVKYKNVNIYYRGARVLNLTLTHLLGVVGLEKAERIILGGLSAGGLALFVHADYIRSIIPAQIPVHGFVDGAFFLDEKNIYGHDKYRNHMRDIFLMQNASGSMDKGCLNAMYNDEKWKCFFAKYTYPYIRTPLFIINPAYDSWQQWYILNLRCHPLQCPDKVKFLIQHQQMFLDDIKQVYNSLTDGMFISSCYVHVLMISDATWSTYTAEGRTLQQTFGDWYFRRRRPAESRYVDCTTKYDCNPVCAKSWSLAVHKRLAVSLRRSVDF